jgi:hypothetical protein
MDPMELQQKEMKVMQKKQLRDRQTRAKNCRQNGNAPEGGPVVLNVLPVYGLEQRRTRIIAVDSRVSHVADANELGEQV